jgi:hypothetical protein
MWEEGTVIEVDKAGGSIAAFALPSPVSYEIHAAGGRILKRNDPVCFDRDLKRPNIAVHVWAGSCAAAKLASQLVTTFHEQLGDAQLEEDGQQEVLRMSADRAARILRPLRRGDQLPDVVKRARLALATAAMELMATEAANIEGKITANSLRDVLRGQRPSLPRKAKP